MIIIPSEAKLLNFLLTLLTLDDWCNGQTDGNQTWCCDSSGYDVAIAPLVYESQTVGCMARLWQIIIISGIINFENNLRTLENINLRHCSTHIHGH